MDEQFNLHEIVYVLGILGTMAGLARFYFTRRADRDELIKWRTNMENRVANQEAYAKRIETEGKATDTEHKQLFTDIRSDLQDLKEGQIEIKADIKAHRAACENLRSAQQSSRR